MKQGYHRFEWARAIQNTLLSGKNVRYVYVDLPSSNTNNVTFYDDADNRDDDRV